MPQQATPHHWIQHVLTICLHSAAVYLYSYIVRTALLMLLAENPMAMHIKVLPQFRRPSNFQTNLNLFHIWKSIRVWSVGLNHAGSWRGYGPSFLCIECDRIIWMEHRLGLGDRAVALINSNFAFNFRCSGNGSRKSLFDQFIREYFCPFHTEKKIFSDRTKYHYVFVITTIIQ